MISALSVIFTIVVLDIYFNHDEEEPVPEWAQNLMRKVLVPVTCWKGNCRTCCSGKPVSPAKDGDVEKSLTKLQANSSKPNSAMKGRANPLKNGNVVQPEDQYGKRESAYATEPETAYKWKEIALVLDRFFMYIFVFLVLTTSIVCLSLLISAYNMY